MSTSKSMIEMKRGEREMETKIDTGIKGKEQEIEEEIARKIKAGVEEEGFYRMEFERQKRLLKRIKFEEGKTIQRLVHNIMERYGDEGLQLLKYVEFEAGVEVGCVDKKSLVEIVGELESIPIIRECSKLINRLIENKENGKNEDKNGIVLGVDWERQYKVEAQQRETIEAELKVIKPKYERVLSILQNRAPQEKRHSQKETKKFFEMIEKKDLNNLTNALLKDPSLIFIRDKSKRTLLQEGAMRGWMEGVEVIIDHGIGVEGFVDSVDKDGKTALMEACHCGQLEVVKFLISKGANIEATDVSGMSVLMHASQKAHLEVAEFLILKGVNIEANNNDNGLTALMWATWKGDLEAVEFLISKGANIEAIDNSGYTALMWASYWNKPDIVEFLKSKGAK